MHDIQAESGATTNSQSASLRKRITEMGNEITSLENKLNAIERNKDTLRMYGTFYTVYYDRTDKELNRRRDALASLSSKKDLYTRQLSAYVMMMMVVMDVISVVVSRLFCHYLVVLLMCNGVNRQETVKLWV